MAGQSINDRLTAARYSIAGQGLAKSVCKATTEEVIGPKKKHLDYLLQCTNEPNVSIPQLANLLIERTQNQAWVIVFKALITVHTLMCYGNERFTQYLASSNCKFNLSGFLDKTGTTDQPQLSYDMSTFIRRYAKYINEKAISYRTVAFDFCKVKRGKNEGAVRTLNTDQLLKTLPVLQQHLDALLDFDCTASELNNGVINAAFMLLFRDLIRLFACYNDGIINLLEKFFDMNKKQCRDALDCYKKFLIRMDRVSEFLKVAEAVGIDRGGTSASFSQAPSSLLDALEGHLASLEGKKPPTSTPPATASNQFESVLTALSSTSASFGLASSNGTSNGAATNGANGGGAAATANGTNFSLDELTKQQALAEEEAMYEKLRAEAAKNNPFLSSPGSEAPALAGAAAVPAAPPDSAATIIDLFAAESPAPTGGLPDPAASQANTKASDDLLQLAAGNPFADMMAPPAPPAAAPMHTNGYTPFSSQMQGFVNDNAFAAVFGGVVTAATTHNTGAAVSLMGGAVEGAAPAFPPAAGVVAAAPQPSAFDGFGDIMKPESGVGAAQPVPSVPAGAPAKLISGDLDSSLSSLVDNLNIKGPAVKPQWQSPKTPNKTGGVNWTPPQPTQGNFARPQQQWGPMGAPVGGGMPGAGGQPMMAGAPPVQPAPAAQQPPVAFDPFGAL